MILTERDYDVLPVGVLDVAMSSARVGTKKELRAARRLSAAPSAHDVFAVHVRHAGVTHAEAAYGVMNGQDDHGPASSHAHIIWARNATARVNGESSAERPDPGAFRALVSHIRKQHPTVRTVSADRATGRHRGSHVWTLPAAGNTSRAPRRETMNDIADELILGQLREQDGSSPKSTISGSSGTYSDSQVGSMNYGSRKTPNGQYTADADGASAAKKFATSMPRGVQRDGVVSKLTGQNSQAYKAASSSAYGSAMRAASSLPKQ